MRDVLPILEQWSGDGHAFALATVVETWGSSPRPVGSVMGVREDGQICGSVSGGCVEGATVQACLSALETGQPCLLDFGSISDAEVWDVGLSCGGRIKVLVEPQPYRHFPEIWEAFTAAIRHDQPAVVTTSLDPWRKVLGESEGFVHRVAPRDHLLIIGASHIAIPLIRFARELGFSITLIDPRASLADPARLGEVDRLIVGWPNEHLSHVRLDAHTYAVTLSHDPRIDDVALRLLIRSEVAYAGALGSRSTQAARSASFLTEGFSEHEIVRIHGPVGLSIGARSPEEIAISILAEIVQVRNRS